MSTTTTAAITTATIRPVLELPVFSAAAMDLIEELRKIPQSDRVAILMTSRPQAGGEFFPLNSVTDPESLITRIQGLKASDTRAHLEESLAAAGGIFKSVGNAPGTKEIQYFGRK